VESGGIGSAIVAVGAGVGVANVGHFGNLLDSEIACRGKRGADGDGEVVEGMGEMVGGGLVTRRCLPSGLKLVVSTADSVCQSASPVRRRRAGEDAD
jgi:hypothetical protein